MGYSRGPKIRRGPPGHSGLTPAAAEGGLLAPKYPGALDTVPLLLDDTTILSAIVLNFAAALVEAIQAEIGPIATSGEDRNAWVAGHPNLMELLDKTNAQTPTFKGFVGLRRFVVTKVHSLFAALNATTVSVAHRPVGVPDPLWFATSNQGNNTNAQMATGATTVAGNPQWAGATAALISLQYRGVAGDGTGAPTGSSSVTVDGILVFMPVGKV